MQTSQNTEDEILGLANMYNCWMYFNSFKKKGGFDS